MQQNNPTKSTALPTRKSEKAEFAPEPEELGSATTRAAARPVRPIYTQNGRIHPV
jgi:hypothetical protein